MPCTPLTWPYVLNEASWGAHEARKRRPEGEQRAGARLPDQGRDRAERPRGGTVWQDFPVWGRCLYDTATAPAAVLDAAERTHPRIISPSGDRHPSGRYQDLSQFQGLAAAPDPLEQSTPLIELTGNSPADARHALTQAGRGRLPDAVLDNLLIGTSEAVTNALLYGGPPATVRIWATPNRTWAIAHPPARHRRCPHLQRRRLHRQAPRRHNHRLTGTGASRIEWSHRAAHSVEPGSHRISCRVPPDAWRIGPSAQTL